VTKTRNPNWGGPRPGAGRKRRKVRPAARVRRFVRLPGDMARAVDRRRGETSMQEYLLDLVARDLEDGFTPNPKEI